MPLGVIILLISIGFAVHAVRTGRPFYWLWLILFLPPIGSVVYFLAEILPELRSRRPVRQAVAQARNALTAERDYRDLAVEVAEAPTVANRIALAEAMLQRGDSGGALAQYRAARVRPHDTDPLLLLGLARCHLARAEPSDALDILEQLLATNPGYQSNDGHLLYARALEACGRSAEALSEYSTLVPIFPGQEARTHFAATLYAVERGSNYSRGLEREWYDIAKRYAGG